MNITASFGISSLIENSKLIENVLKIESVEDIYNVEDPGKKATSVGRVARHKKWRNNPVPSVILPTLEKAETGLG